MTNDGRVQIFHPATGNPDVDVANREAAVLICRWFAGDQAGVINRLTSLGLQPADLVRVSTGLLIAMVELVGMAGPTGKQLYLTEIRNRFGITE
jgi:hypothetical protein